MGDSINFDSVKANELTLETVVDMSNPEKTDPDAHDLTSEEIKYTSTTLSESLIVSTASENCGMTTVSHQEPTYEPLHGKDPSILIEDNELQKVDIPPTAPVESTKQLKHGVTSVLVEIGQDDSSIVSNYSPIDITKAQCEGMEPILEDCNDSRMEGDALTVADKNQSSNQDSPDSRITTQMSSVAQGDKDFQLRIDEAKVVSSKRRRKLPPTRGTLDLFGLITELENLCQTSTSEAKEPNCEKSFNNCAERGQATVTPVTNISVAISGEVLYSDDELKESSQKDLPLSNDEPSGQITTNTIGDTTENLKMNVLLERGHAEVDLERNPESMQSKLEEHSFFSEQVSQTSSTVEIDVLKNRFQSTFQAGLDLVGNNESVRPVLHENDAKNVCENQREVFPKVVFGINAPSMIQPPLIEFVLEREEGELTPEPITEDEYKANFTSKAIDGNTNVETKECTNLEKLNWNKKDKQHRHLETIHSSGKVQSSVSKKHGTDVEKRDRVVSVQEKREISKKYADSQKHDKRLSNRRKSFEDADRFSDSKDNDRFQFTKRRNYQVRNSKNAENRSEIKNVSPFGTSTKKEGRHQCSTDRRTNSGSHGTKSTGFRDLTAETHNIRVEKDSDKNSRALFSGNDYESENRIVGNVNKNVDTAGKKQYTPENNIIDSRHGTKRFSSPKHSGSRDYNREGSKHIERNSKTRFRDENKFANQIIDDDVKQQSSNKSRTEENQSQRFSQKAHHNQNPGTKAKEECLSRRRGTSSRNDRIRRYSSSSRPSRRDVYLNSLKHKENKSERNRKQKKEKQRAKSLVKRQMKFISQHIVNKDPESHGATINNKCIFDLGKNTIIIQDKDNDTRYTDDIYSKQQHRRDNSTNENIDFEENTSLNQNISSLDDMEAFLDRLRVTNRQKILKSSNAYNRLWRLQKDKTDQTSRLLHNKSNVKTGELISEKNLRSNSEMESVYDGRKRKLLFFQSAPPKPKVIDKITATTLMNPNNVFPLEILKNKLEISEMGKFDGGNPEKPNSLDDDKRVTSAKEISEEIRNKDVSMLENQFAKPRTDRKFIEKNKPELLPSEGKVFEFDDERISKKTKKRKEGSDSHESNCEEDVVLKESVQINVESADSDSEIITQMLNQRQTRVKPRKTREKGSGKLPSVTAQLQTSNEEESQISESNSSLSEREERIFQILKEKRKNCEARKRRIYLKNRKRLENIKRIQAKKANDKMVQMYLDLHSETDESDLEYHEVNNQRAHKMRPTLKYLLRRKREIRKKSKFDTSEHEVETFSNSDQDSFDPQKQKEIMILGRKRLKQLIIPSGILNKKNTGRCIIRKSKRFVKNEKTIPAKMDAVSGKPEKASRKEKRIDTNGELRKRRIECKEARTRSNPAEIKDDVHKKLGFEECTLEKMEDFLQELRAKRITRENEEGKLEVEMSKPHFREAKFLNRLSAKRKAKLMACVASTKGATIKEAKFLEALTKMKCKRKPGEMTELDLKKERLLKKIKAEREAVMQFGQPVTQNKNLPKISSTSVEDSAKSFFSKDYSTDKMEDFLLTLRDDKTSTKNSDFDGNSKTKASMAKKPPNEGYGDIVKRSPDGKVSKRAQNFLNSLRAKKKAQRLLTKGQKSG